MQKLNINYLTKSAFENQRKFEYLSVENKQLEFSYIPYFKRAKNVFDGVIIEANIFLLNGKNYYLNIINSTKKAKKISVELNIPLPRGYYFFKKNYNNFEITNLTSKEKGHFNFCVKDGISKFSCMNGIESCTYACINMKCEIALMPGEIKKLLFNLGAEKMSLTSSKDIQRFFDVSQFKANEIFDVKITSKNAKFDDYFNRVLPQDVWEGWLKGEANEYAESELLKIKKQILVETKAGIKINDKFEGLKEVKIFKGNIWKRVFIVHNNAKYLFAGRIKYYNFDILTKEIFDKNNEIYLSFV